MAVERPLLGLTLSNELYKINRLRGSQHRLLINDEYLKFVIHNGFTPVLLPYSEDPEPLDDLMLQLDGLLLSGGGDLDPSVWRDAVTPDFEEAGRRTRAEDRQLSRALELGLPVFGICRGFQQINCCLGGTLIEDIPTDCPDALPHKQSLPGDIPVHNLEWRPDSWLGRTVGAAASPVNSFHHQTIAQPAADLEVCGRAPDGIIEAVEYKGEGFMVAVQFHPERMPLAPAVQSIIRGFHDVCAEYRRNRR